MDEPKFSQPARRNLLAPVLIAFLLLGIAIALLLRFTPHTIAEIKVVHVAVYPAHTVFKSDTIVVGRDRSQDDLYALITVNMSDRLNLPIFIKDFTGTLISADGTAIPGTAAQKEDLENLYVTFPALRSLSSTPLLRETLISPGGTADGMVLLHFPVSADTWNHRRSAALNIDLYHQGMLSAAIPQGNSVSPSPQGGESAN
ncbi:MAG: hypothetical protein JSS95_17270 [Acidobacteria bacterium]|nr:hypothetical protein [Acidobacteriota bacterium]